MRKPTRVVISLFRGLVYKWNGKRSAVALLCLPVTRVTSMQIFERRMSRYLINSRAIDFVFVVVATVVVAAYRRHLDTGEEPGSWWVRRR